MKDTALYQGHLPDGSSIQARSAGGLYPFVMYGQGLGDNIKWGYTAPGKPGKLIGTYDEACAQAELAKKVAAMAKEAVSNIELAQQQWDAYAVARARPQSIRSDDFNKSLRKDWAAA